MLPAPNVSCDNLVEVMSEVNDMNKVKDKKQSERQYSEDKHKIARDKRAKSRAGQ